MTKKTKPPGTDALSDEASPDQEAGIKTADRRGILLTSIPKWTAWAIIAWQARLSIEALAGRNASFLMRFGRETSYSELGCWAAGLMGILYGLYNHHLLRLQMTKGVIHMAALENRVKGVCGAGGPET